MNIETFNNLLDAHGADIQSWPDPEAAQEFLQRVPKAREELALALRSNKSLPPEPPKHPPLWQRKFSASCQINPKPPPVCGVSCCLCFLRIERGYPQPAHWCLCF